jgi:hypothetical protein
LSVEERRTLPATEKEGESMMRHSETMRAASRLLLSHPIVCLLGALAAVVVVVAPTRGVDAAEVARPVEAETFDVKPTGTSVVTNTTLYSNDQAPKSAWAIASGYLPAL